MAWWYGKVYEHTKQKFDVFLKVSFYLFLLKSIVYSSDW